MKYRYGYSSALLSFIPVGLFYATISLILLYFIYPHIYLLKNEVLITLSLFAIWRYGWMIINYSRALIYRFYSYPKIKEEIAHIPEHLKYPKHLYFMIPSYKEEDWVSIETFRSILSEVQTIPSAVTIVVATAEKKEDAVITQIFKAYRGDKKIDLIFQHQKDGKRIAMGHALRAIARRYHQLALIDPNSVTIFMDGDSYMESGFLQKILPVFATDKNLGAVTTNEVAFIDTKSKWYKEWFNMKFGQRHIQFQSHSLSRKVMTLTGRLSAYRTDIVIKEDFISKVEHDVLIHPLHGKFRFLMGDDKSTWFYLLKNSYNMLYIPDALCYSIESRDGNFFELSISLPFRWNGNMLRNNSRALALGAKKTGLFIWFVILDQRMNMWTSLVGITSAIILAIFKSIYYLLFFFIWIIFIRLFQLLFIAFGGHSVSLYSLPLMLYSQWVGAIVKIRAFYDLANQKWSKNGASQNSDANIAMIDHPFANKLPKLIMYSSAVTFIFILVLSHGILYVPNLNAFCKSQAKIESLSPIEQVVNLEDYGVGQIGVKNSAQIINSFIKKFNGKSLVLNLPSGEINIYEPIIIDKDNVTLKGKGSNKTVIISHLKKPYISAIHVEGKGKKKIGYLRREIKKGASIFTFETKKREILSDSYFLLREPNDKQFLKKLGSKRWHKKYPYLRQQIIKTVRHDPKSHLVYTQKPILLDLSSISTELYSLSMVKNVKLRDFKIIQKVPNDDIDKYAFVYKNRLPKFQVDAIRFDYAVDSSIKRVAIHDSGRHALVFENSYNLLADDLDIDKSWNKGKGGSGYLRVARTYHSEIKNSTLKNIRHLTLQWSSAGNHIHHMNMGVDLNLHGGFTHDNKVDNLNFNVPSRHKWREITRTPKNAKWAPPDGKNMIDKSTMNIGQKEKCDH